MNANCTQEFGQNLADDPFRSGAYDWATQATDAAARLPSDFYINSCVYWFLRQLADYQLHKLLVCIELEQPYRDYLEFADLVEWMFTENGGKTVNHKVKAAVRGFVVGRIGA